MRLRKELWFGFSLMAIIIVAVVAFMPWGGLIDGHLSKQDLLHAQTPAPATRNKLILPSAPCSEHSKEKTPPGHAGWCLHQSRAFQPFFAAGFFRPK